MPFIMPLTKEQAELRAVDQSYDEGPIKELQPSGRKGWSITLASGIGFFLTRDQLNGRKPPKLGDTVRIYNVLGSRICGVDLRDEPLFYKTQAELDVEHELWRREYHERKRKDFERNRRKLDRQFAALPAVFQRRISWFRAWNPDFRWQNEAYEMNCCADAVKIAETMKTQKGVQRFAKLSYKKQRETVPDLYEGHSDNSFSLAVRLARLYLHDPLLVIAEHGALTPIVGCDEYGCAHPRPADVEDAIDRSWKEEAA